VLGDRLRRNAGNELGTPLGDGLRVGKDLDREPQRYSVFSTWPPNCFRMADRSRFSKSSSPRDENRE
jgi:hypothetical protein